MTQLDRSLFLACTLTIMAAACGSGPGVTDAPPEPELTFTSTGALPLGTMTVPAALPSCPGGFSSGASCFRSTVSCPSTAPLPVTYGVRTPSGDVRGTIVLHDGGGGTTPFNHGTHDGRTFVESLLSAGYRVVQLAWASDWEDTDLPQKNVRLAACRPATLLRHVYEHVHGGASAPGGMGALGHSGGTGALGYALSWYGAGDFLDKAMFSSGPVFSDISRACEVPPVPTQACTAGQFGCSEGGPWTGSPEVGEGHATEFRTYTGIASCSDETHPPTSAELDAMRGMSIIDRDGSVFVNFPKTAVSAWLCTAYDVPAGALGAMYFAHFTSPRQAAVYTLNPVNGCSGEGTWNGTHPVNGVALDAFTLMVQDLTDPVAGCVKRH